MESELAAARKAAAKAASDLERARQTADDSRSALEQAEAALREAQERVAEVEAAFKEAKTRAEFSKRDIPDRSAATLEKEIAAGLATARQIDEHMERYWAERKLTPASPADDATFCRRAALDVTGTIPRPDVLREFLADTRPDKRARFVARLLDDPRSADYAALWMRSWILEAAPVVGQGSNTVELFAYLREVIALDVGYDQMVRELLTAEGLNTNDGAVSFPMLWEAKAPELAAATSRLFLGVNLQCAQCHDDMIEGWEQDDFWGLAAFFTGLASKPEPNGSAYPKRPRTEYRQTHLPGGLAAVPGDEGEDRAIVHTRDVPVVIPSSTNKDQKRLMGPKPLGGARMDRIRNGARRAALADWLAAADNPYLDRTIVNRVWQHFFGEGFVAAPDGFQPSAKILHESLLNELCADFRAHGRSLKHLRRAIASSQVYQLATRVEPPEKGAFTHARLRRLDSDQWFDSLLRATGMDDTIARRTEGGKDQDLAGDLRWFRHEVSRTVGPTASSLLELNTWWVRRGLAEGTAIDRVLKLPAEERLDEAFVCVLSRPPSEGERNEFDPVLREADGREALFDAFWVLINSTEFVTH